jgi:peptidoglycan/xylan/chitin deacetylase (PgdA/CDA1 family)
LPILTYHNIGVAPDGATHRGLYLSPAKLRFHFGVLAALGWRGVSIADALPYLGGEARGRVAALTFDDGYVDNLELALPALQAHGFGATCFLVAGQLGGYNAWDAELLRVRKPLMDLAQLRAWLAGGMHVGSHTLTHPHLPQLDTRAKRREIVDSKAMLEDRLGVPIEHFCFPYGDHDAECIDLVAEAGYRSAVTTVRRTVHGGDRLHALPRLPNGGRRSRARFLLRALRWGR